MENCAQMGLTDNQITKNVNNPGDSQNVFKPWIPFAKEELHFLEKCNIRVDLMNCVGRGTFGALFVSLTEKYGYVVLKRYETYDQGFNEVEALQLFGKRRPHNNIIAYYDSLIFKNHLYLLIEYSNVGDLDRFYLQNFSVRKPNESEIFEIFFEIYSGVEHIHRYGWAHRDLKFENVVGFRDVLNPKCIAFKITDFGSAVYAFGRDGKIFGYTTWCGSPFTMPPEVTERPYNVFLHDSYSMGVILYELSHNREFPHLPDFERDWFQKDEWLIAHNKKKHDLKSVTFNMSISQELKSLILSLLEPNPLKRQTLQQIKTSKWWTLRKHEWEHKNKQFCHYPNLH